MKPIVFDLDSYLSTRTKVSGECIEFTNKPDVNGYAKLSQRSSAFKMYGERWLHRITYTRHYGEIPKGVVVMHTCDNPICCNIEHLKLGTQIDNLKDMYNKGRNAKGELSGNNKLTKSDVVYIISYKETHKSTEVATMYNVAPRTIRDIWNNVTWRHI